MLNNRNFRLAITGAQGTGKSTAASRIYKLVNQAYYLGVELAPGITEVLAASRIRAGENANAAALRSYTLAHRKRELQTRNLSRVIFDRCFVDHLAYAGVLDCLDHQEYMQIRTEAMNAIRSYDLVIWLRVTKDYEVVSDSDESGTFRRKIDAEIGRILTNVQTQVMQFSVWQDADFDAIMMAIGFDKFGK